VNTQKAKNHFGNIRISTEIIAIVISVISLLISAVGFYVSSLRAPEISFVTAPYIKHVVDNASLNEAFFVPVTIINQGARPGTVLSFELSVTNQTTEATRTYYGQYFAQENSPTDLGDFFTPITLGGSSSTSRTVCFYPIGTVSGNFLSQKGVYEFQVIAQISNVQNQSSQISEDKFQITVDEGMASAMRAQSDGEYIFPLPIEPIR
jgi:hypothetical protein